MEKEDIYTFEKQKCSRLTYAFYSVYNSTNTNNNT